MVGHAHTAREMESDSTSKGDESIQERPEFAELRGHIRQLVMDEYRAQQAQMRPVSFSE